MDLIVSRTEAPHLGRTVLVAPNRRVNLAQAGHRLVTIVPRTRLGAVALDFAVASSVATIQIIATSSYVNALTALSPPPITFSAPPPGTTLSVQSLQGAYDSFVRELAYLQGQAAAWISTSSGSGGASIFSLLVTIAQMIGNLNGTVQSDFVLLQNMPPTSSSWQAAFTNAQSLIGAEVGPLQNVQSEIRQLSGNLDTAASTLTSAATTGVLAQLQAAYQNELTALNQDITACNNEISSDNAKIAALGAADGASVVVGVMGVLNIWNPLGWLALGAGVAGAYFATEELEALKAQVGVLEAQAKTYAGELTVDEQASVSITAFSGSAQSAAAMNSASQQELNTLIQLCGSLVQNMNLALTDLSNDEMTQALAEWNAVIAQAAFLGGITAYVWPSWIMLANPTSLAAAGSNAWLVSNSGVVFGWASGAQAWSTLPGCSLSVVSAGTVIAGIDGAPDDAAQVDSNSYGQSFLVKLFNSAQSVWTTISTFPAAQIATDGTSVWAVSQLTSDRQTYVYSGSGTSWTSLGELPNDTPASLAAANGTVAAIGTNSAVLWTNGGSSWQQIGTATYTSITANGGLIGLVDASSNAWVLDIAGNNALTAMMTGVNVLAQAANGDQYATDSSLNLWYVAYPQSGSSAVCTQVMQNVVGVTIADSGAVYALDDSGVLWTLTSSANNTWRQLPALPS